MGQHMSLCTNDTRRYHNVTPPFSRHNMTVAVEVSAAGFSLAVCTAFFIGFFVLLVCPEGRSSYSWPSAARIVSLASMTLLQCMTFFVSASYGFEPSLADYDFCHVQGMVYQFATSAIAMEVFAVSFAAYQTCLLYTSPSPRDRG